MSAFVRLLTGVAFGSWGPRSPAASAPLGPIESASFFSIGTSPPAPTSEPLRRRRLAATVRAFSIGLVTPSAVSHSADDYWDDPWNAPYAPPERRARTQAPRVLWSKRVGM